MTTKVFNIDVYGSNKLGAKDLFKERVKYQNSYPDNITYDDPERVTSKTRNIYDSFVVPDDELDNMETPDPINFWSSKYANYGKLDLNRDYIVPNNESLKQIKTEEETVFVMNFVADAFEDFVKFIKTQRANRLHPDNFLTKNIQAKKGWFDVDNLYDRITTQYYNNFVTVFLPKTKLDKQIRDFESFLDVFLNLYAPEMMLDFPITKTGVLESIRTSPNVSGLCVEMSFDNHDDDYNKFNKYINNINFEFYTLAAAKFGFFVDKNAPWRLVANLNSSKMKEYMQKYFFTIEKESFTGAVLNHSHDFSVDENGNGATGPAKQTGNLANFAHVPEHQHTIEKGNVLVRAVYGANPLHAHIHSLGPAKKYIKNFTLHDVYDGFYNKSYETDVTLLRDKFKNFYFDYVRQFPYTKSPELCLPKSPGPGQYRDNSSKSKTVVRKIRRDAITEEKFNLQYNDLFWMKTYLIIRIKEKTNGKGKLDKRLDKVMSDINQLYYSVDKSSALEYINQYLKQYY